MTCVKSTICDIKKAWNRPVVYSTSRGSSIAYLSRTDNVRAHADMKIHAVRFIYTNTHCALMGTMVACSEPHGNDIITPGASTVATFKT